MAPGHSTEIFWVLFNSAPLLFLTEFDLTSDWSPHVLSTLGQGTRSVHIGTEMLDGDRYIIGMPRASQKKDYYYLS